MIVNIQVEKDFDIKILSVKAEVRYWEDGTIDGVADERGDLTPCRVGNMWRPEIDIETGRIINWKQGVTASIHYKVCDSGTYSIRDINSEEVIYREDYVPGCLCPKENGYGDYIIMDINADGMIQGWKFKISDFNTED